MRYTVIPSSFFIRNRKNFVSQIIKNSAAVFFSADRCPRNGDQYFPFRQDSNFFYLTGIEQEKSILLLSPGCPNEKLREVLFLLKPEKTMEIWEGHKLTQEEATALSGIENVRWLEEFDLTLKEVLSYTDDLYFDSNEFIKFKPETESRTERLGNAIRREYPLHRHHRAAPLLTKQRLIKSEEEISLLKEAAAITRKAFEKVLRFTRPGVWEFEVEAEITAEFIRNRSAGHGYIPIVASGKNACVLHYVENDKQCREGDLMLMDFGAEYANYTADMSRTIPVSGRFSPRQKECYNAVLRVMKEVKKMYVPGNTINDINDAAGRLMEKELVKLGFFTEKDVAGQPKEKPLYKKYFMHGTAHFLGMDVHDVGSKTEPLKPGMVLTCEPGLYVPEENCGIRIENDILITETGPVDLMETIPVEADEIERLMNSD